MPDCRGRPTFLNLDEPYPYHIFTALIWGRNRAKFREPPERAFLDRVICVTGLIETCRGVPQIEGTEPRQIELQQRREAGPRAHVTTRRHDEPAPL